MHTAGTSVMRLIFLLVSAAVVSSAPSRAHACRPLVGVTGYAPSERFVAPFRAQYLVRYWPTGPVSASLFYFEPIAPEPLTVEPLGPSYVTIRLPTLQAQPIGIQITLDDIPGREPFYLPVSVSDLDDLTPPSPPVLRSLRLDWTEADPCYGAGTWLEIEISPSDDDWGIAGYAVYEETSDGRVVVGASHDEGQPPPLQNIAIFEPGPDRTTGRCFHVVALDFAGNESGRSATRCTGDVPIIDAGVPDRGVVSSRDIGGELDAEVAADTAVRNDAEVRTGELSSVNDGCRCVAVTPSWPALIGFGLLLYVRRWRRNQAQRITA